MSLTNKILILIATVTLFAGSYINYYLVKTSLEIEYDIKEVPLKMSPDTIDIIQCIIRVFTVVLVALIAVKCLKRMKMEFKWIITVTLLLFSVVLLYAFYDFEINSLVYYERYRYINSLSYIAVEVLLLVVALLMLFERFLFTKIIGSLIFLFMCWEMFSFLWDTR